MNKVDWKLSVGTFPGLLLGMRTYQEETMNNHVWRIWTNKRWYNHRNTIFCSIKLYLGFVDVCLTIYKN